MNDFRREITEGFARQQAQIDDVTSTGDRILRGAMAARPRSSQLWPSMAGVALVLVAAVAVATSIIVRGLHPVTSHGPSPTPTVRPTPSPTALAVPLRVPATTPIIAFRDPVDSNQVDGTTWDGSAKGKLARGLPSGGGFSSNPAGTLFGSDQILDRSGAVVAAIPAPTKGINPTWSDDGQHYCRMVFPDALGQPNGVPATLQVAQVGQAPRNVAQVGREYEQTIIHVAACSVTNDRAIVVQSLGQGIGTAQFWVVRLSTGQILWTKTYSYSPDGLMDIRASIDGQFIAEAPFGCCPYGNGTTTIYSPTGAVLGHVNGAVQGFSWDGSLAVVANYGGPVSIVRWRDGSTVWKSAPDARYAEALAEPGGERIAVSVLDPNHAQTGGFPPIDVDVVSPDGKAVRILTNVLE